MSERAEFFRAICFLAADGQKEALQRILEEADRILTLTDAERLIMEGYKKQASSGRNSL
jgi:hypothetical protein